MTIRNISVTIQKRYHSFFLYFRKQGDGKDVWEYLKDGECVIIEGGPSTGKTATLHKVKRALEQVGENVIFINASLPLGDWVKEYRLFGKSLEKRVECFLSNLPERFYLVIDNAEKVSDSRKLELVLYLLEKCRSAVVGCFRQSYINPKLRARLKTNKIYHLGTGADTFDCTYFVVALMIIFVAIVGYHHLIFLAAAMRYMFQGTRVGGHRV
jgi:hypothetical protein